MDLEINEDFSTLELEIVEAPRASTYDFAGAIARARLRGYHGRAYVCDVSEELGLSDAEGREVLLSAHRAGHVTLRAANLVDAQDVSKVRRSEVEFGGPLHYVQG